MTRRGAFAAGAFLALILGCATPAGTVYPAGVPGAEANPPARCVPDCASDQRCNPETRSCERLPCGGRCTEQQHCDASGPVEQCVSNTPG
jgi:hypothetical protein